MSLIASLHRLGDAFLEYRSRSRTERLVSALPADVRKDIGWPVNFAGVERRGLLNAAGRP